MLDALGSAGALATFFVVAPLAERYPGLLRRMADEGHGVAFHCSRHARHDRLSAEEILSDTTEGLRSLRALGHEAGDWRAPWGLVTPDTEAVAAELRLRLVGWTADSEDWRGEPAAAMLARLAPGVAAGAIVLMHDGLGPGASRDGCGETVELISPLVFLARSRSLSPVPVAEMAVRLPDRNPGPVSGV